MNEVKKIDGKYIVNSYARNDLYIERGKGVNAYDESGKEYIDFTSGIGVNSLGFCDDDWVKAITEQAGKLQHTSNLFYTKPGVELAEKLCKKTDMKKVFFSNSGAEANEGALKAARKYSFDKYGNNRYEIISLVNSFHGRTLFTLTATGQDTFHIHYNPMVPGFKYVKANDKEGLASSIDNKTCAIIMEMIQGEGGVIPLDKEYVKYVAKICEEKDLILIIDEVQTGVGRTGKFLCYENYEINPDIVTMAKGLGGGLPIGAILFNDKTEDVFSFGDHGSTFGANPVVCSGANIVIDKISEEFLANINEKGNYLKKQLETIPQIAKVDGMGMMLGAELKEGISAKEVVAKCIEKGILLLTAKTRLRFLPPLIIEKEDIDKGIEVLKYVLARM